MSRVRFGLRTTWVRTFLGSSPDLEAGTRRQEDGDVVVDSVLRTIRPFAWPMSSGGSFLPLLQVLSWSPQLCDGTCPPRGLRSALPLGVPMMRLSSWRILCSSTSHPIPGPLLCLGLHRRVCSVLPKPSGASGCQRGLCLSPDTLPLESVPLPGFAASPAGGAATLAPARGHPRVVLRCARARVPASGG
jgi:hypothetical protein